MEEPANEERGNSEEPPASNSEQAGEGKEQPPGEEKPQEGAPVSDSKVDVEETAGKETGEPSNGDTATAAADKPDPKDESKPTSGEGGGTSGGGNQPNATVENKVSTPPPTADSTKVAAVEESKTEAKKDDDVAQSSSPSAPSADQVSSPNAETTGDRHGDETGTTEQAPKPPRTSDPPTGGSDISEQPTRPETLEVGGAASGSSSGENPTLSSSTRARKERKGRKKSRRSVEGTAVPGLRRRSSKVESRSRHSASTTTGASGHKHLEIVILSAFHLYDPEGTGYVNEATFWDLLQSPKLNLQLSYEELAHLQNLILPDQAGMIPYAEFATQATDITASLYANQPPSEAHWVELTTEDGSIAIILNKQTGEVMDKAESGIDAFAGVIEELYKKTDSEEKGYVTWKMFSQLLQSAEMSPYLGEQDVKDMKKLFSSVPNGKASYDNFCPLAKEMILRVYRARDPSDNPWCKLNIPEVGEVWFNKFTGETHRGLQTGDSREHEIAFINHAYAQVEEITFELEQHKQLNRDLENQLAKAAEDQETLEAQLYETGNALDEANNEVLRWEGEVNQMRGMVTTKDQEMDLLRLKLTDMDGLKQRIAEMEQELQKARDTIANRDSSITERDTNIMSLQRQADAVTDELKTAHGEKDAQDSALSKIKHQLQLEQKKVKEYEKSVPELESELSSTKDQLETTKRSLDEKTAALVQSRKHLKNARERGLVLEKDIEKLEQTHDKLSSAESEIRTLKTFLTTKTALIEKHKKDLRETRLKVAELEEKDARRAVILADVLEKTARQYQQQIGHSPLSGRGSPKLRRYQVAESQTSYLDEPRPYSAPAVPPEGTQGTEETDFHSASPRQGVVKTFTTQSTGPILTRFRPQGGVSQGHTRGSRTSTKVKNRSRSVPKLPPITRGTAKQQRAKSFVFPTSNDLRYENKIRDAMDIDHTPSNPQCACQLCRMNSTVVGTASNRRPETGLTGMTAKTTGLPGYQGETDVREVALAEQLHIGQRVLVRMKKSEFDIEPTQLTGIIKYVGKVDREYVDHRIYVGVKLDEAAGDTDGLFKQKRYFSCPPKHGKLVRITSVVAVLPPKSVFYKSLQEISKRSPYTTVQKKLSAQA